MSEVSGSSISKGVFVCKGKKLRANPRDYYIGSKKKPNLELECGLRMEVFENLWNKTSAEIMSLQSELNAKVLDDLISFVKYSSSGVLRGDCLQRHRVVREIPTAALVTGVNVPDHSAMFSSLVSMLEKCVTPHVAVLKSINCQTIHSIISDTVSQLLNTSDSLNNEEDFEDQPEKPPLKKRTSSTMSSISRWYAGLYKGQYGHSSKSKGSSKVESPDFKPSLQSPQKVSCENTSPRPRHMTPVTLQAKHLQKMTLRSPRKYAAVDDLDLYSAPTRRSRSVASGTPQKPSGTTPRKSARLAERSPQNLGNSMKGSRLGKSVAEESPNSLTVLLDRMPQNLASRCKIIADNSPVSFPGTPKKKTSSDNFKSPQKIRCSPRLKDLPASPVSSSEATRSLWSLPQKDLHDSSPRSSMKSPRKRTAEIDRVPSSRKQLEFEKTAVTKSVKPVVIVFKDFEGFPNHVLQDFITICGNHLDELPLVMVFGIATTVGAVHRALPHAVSSILSMEKFQIPPSSDCLTQVLTKVLMTNAVPFKLSAKVFNFLLDIFLYHDFSVVGFIQALKFTMLEHFYSNCSSILCQTTKNVSEQVMLLSAKQLDDVRSCMSFRRFVERQPPAEQIKLLDDNNYAKKVVIELIESIEKYHSTIYPVLLCLHTVVHKLPQWPLGRQVRELYASCLGGNICDSQDYERAMNLIRALSREELQANLRQMSCHLRAEVSDELSIVRDQLDEHCAKLDQVEDLSLPHFTENLDDSSVEDAILPKKLTMYTLREKLRKMERKNKVPTKFEVLRDGIVDYLDSIFRKYLGSYRNLVLHEVFYYDDVDRLRKCINASPRATIQNALTQPNTYLHNDLLDLDPGQLTSDLPDVSLVYKLHLECSRLINLYDWLQAFVTIVQSEAEPGKSGTKSVDRVIQARFIQAVSELQFLGFIKPTRRKTDHVARLTWGGC